MGVEHIRDELEATLRQIEHTLSSEMTEAMASQGVYCDPSGLLQKRSDILKLLQVLPEQDPIRMGDMT
jgi:hypothetical protein